MMVKQLTVDLQKKLVKLLAIRGTRHAGNWPAHLEGNKGVEEVKEDVGSPKERIVKVLDTILNDYYEKGYATEHEHFKLEMHLLILNLNVILESSPSAILDFYGPNG